MTTLHRPSPLRLWLVWQALPALALAFAAGAMALAPTVAQAEGALGVSGGNASGRASASLQFRLVVPAVMRVLENSHPSQLEATADGELVGQQRLVVVSNMKHGFCVALRRNQPQSGQWQLQAAETGGTTITPTADGYRLCTSRPGRYSLLLQHSFQPTATATATAMATNGNTNTNTTLTAMAWPVQTDITAL